jgi:hypothetical protein
MGWKDIDLERPQQASEVLVAVDDDMYLATYRENDNGYWFDTEDGHNDITNATHWMDKPNPPEW